MVAPGFPRTAQELLRRGEDFRTELRAYKQRTRLPGGWYPFESLSSLAIVADLLSTSFPEILDSCAARPAADIGCGDGDFALLLANWGMAVDAIDYEPNNFNGMRGVDTARQALGLPVDVHRIDLDKLADRSAIKVPLAELVESKEKVRSALNRATRKAGRTVATASDASYLYVWNISPSPQGPQSPK